MVYGDGYKHTLTVTIALVSGYSAKPGQRMGRPVRLVDGTTVSKPDTAANQVAYPQSRGQKLGLGFPLCRMFGIVCLSSGAVLNAALGAFEARAVMSKPCCVQRSIR